MHGETVKSSLACMQEGVLHCAERTVSHTTHFMQHTWTVSHNPSTPNCALV